MSYTILYRSMFAKVGEDKYIPMIEVGDNNCYEGTGRYQRRCRSWQNWRVPGYEKKIILSKREIMRGIYQLLDNYNTRYVNKPIHGDEKNGYWTYKSIEQNFGWLSGIAISGKHTTMTTARMVANFFKRGFEQCYDLTSGEFVPTGLYLIEFKSYPDPDSSRTNTKYFPTDDGLEKMVDFLREADGLKTWVVYDAAAEYIWNTVRNRKNR